MTNQNIVKKLFKIIPEFEMYARNTDEDIDLPYMVFGALATYIKELADKKDEILLKSCFDLLDSLINSGDSSAYDLVMTGTFELLSDSEDGISIAQKYLVGKSLDAFNIVVEAFKE